MGLQLAVLLVRVATAPGTQGQVARAASAGMVGAFGERSATLDQSRELELLPADDPSGAEWESASAIRAANRAAVP
ncbi:MAG: hypothetical protein MUQ32_04130 [Chloroflexi bacterium]|nr:hypothetical protein [Chloroflexota bacterium]